MPFVFSVGERDYQLRVGVNKISHRKNRVGGVWTLTAPSDRLKQRFSKTFDKFDQKAAFQLLSKGLGDPAMGGSSHHPDESPLRPFSAP